MKKIFLIGLLYVLVGCWNTHSEKSRTLFGVYGTYFPKQTKLIALQLKYDATLIGGGKLKLKEDSSFVLIYPPYTKTGVWSIHQDSLNLHVFFKENYSNKQNNPIKEEKNEIIVFGIKDDQLTRLIHTKEERLLEIFVKQN